MGKRKFKKPDESESEYEWEESKPCESLKKVDGGEVSVDLGSFLEGYCSKSKADVRKVQAEREKEEEQKRLIDRMCLPGDTAKQQADPAWLKRVYKSMLKQAKECGGDLISMLRERYDDDTIRRMQSEVREFNVSYNKHNQGGRQTNHGKYSRDTYKSSDRYKEKHSDYYKGENYYNHDDKEKSAYNKSSNSYDNDNDYNITKKVNNDQKYNTNDITKDVEERYVTMVDLNEASAAMIKAELSGNHQKIAKLRKRVEILREAQRRNLKIRLTKQKKEYDKDNSVMIEKTLKSGRMVPYVETGNKFVSQSKTFENMKREENCITADDNDMEFVSIAGKISSKRSRYEDTGEREYASASIKRQPEKEKQAAISSQKKRTIQVSRCKRCYKNMAKHLVLSKGEYFCLIVPEDLGITDFHFQIVPIDHVAASTRLDEDSWIEMTSFKKQITNFFTKELKSECVFMETVVGLCGNPHMTIDCIPLSVDRDTYCISNKVFFKKAIEEAKSEWCQNKKIIEVKQGDIRNCVPKEFPYFSVDFGIDGGLAFVIDDEKKFSNLFGLEIVGSLLDKNQIEIKNRKEKSFNQQADAVLKAEKRWKSYDLWKRPESDEDSDY